MRLASLLLCITWFVASDATVKASDEPCKPCAKNSDGDAEYKILILLPEQVLLRDRTRSAHRQAEHKQEVAVKKCKNVLCACCPKCPTKELGQCCAACVREVCEDSTETITYEVTFECDGLPIQPEVTTWAEYTVHCVDGNPKLVKADESQPAASADRDKAHQGRRDRDAHEMSDDDSITRKEVAMAWKILSAAGVAAPPPDERSSDRDTRDSTFPRRRANREMRRGR